MKISRKEILETAALAQLFLSDEEVTYYREYLSNILTHFMALDKVDTNGIQPLTSVQRGKGQMRPDVVGKSLSKDQVLQNAPRVKGGMFKVPSTLIEGDIP